MRRVLIVCGAGASSTFLARRISDLAREAGFSWSVSPVPLDSVASEESDLVALSSHVVTDEVERDFRGRGVSFVTLPASVRGGFGAEIAFEAIAQFFDARGGQSDVAGTDMKEIS